jgi:hypothetical protein
MKVWVRRVEGDTTWHWCKNCPYYPYSGERVLLTEKIPDYGDFCQACKRLERERKCKLNA